VFKFLIFVIFGSPSLTHFELLIGLTLK